MPKQIHEDQDMRSRIRMKCVNDWGIKLNEDQITMGIIEQEEQKLSIWHNQLWPNKRSYKDKSDNNQWKIKITWDKTIDGYRAIAHRNGFAGIEPTKFDEADGKLVMATVTVYRLGPDGNKYPYVGQARFSEVAPRDKGGKISLTGQWKTAPYNQLSVAAQRQALRLAFQEFDYQSDFDEVTEVPTEDFEPDAEPSRGGAAPATAPTDPEPEAKAKADPAPPKEEKKKGEYVGVPKGGFKFGMMYNEKERIVAFMTNKRGKTVIALDSGIVVRVTEDGHEDMRQNRSEKTPGGLEWKEGMPYYDGAKVEKVASAKKNDQHVWLALDNGFKVRLDEWGKEMKRKERKASDKQQDKATPAATASEGAAESAPKHPSIKEVKAMTEKEPVRQACFPLMSKYCIDVLDGKKISPKAMHERLTGEVLTMGNKMGVPEYHMLYECLTEALAAHARGEEYPAKQDKALGG